MTTQTVQSSGPVVMPGVNLMPPEIAEAERLHRIQRAMVGAVVLSVLLVGALYYHAKQGMTSAQNQLTAAQSQQTSLQTKYNGLDNVQAVFTEVQAKQDLLQQGMGQEIRWSFLLNDLTTTVPDNVWLTGINATETTAPGSTAVPAVGADGSSTGIGTIAFTGEAFSHDDLANWLQSTSKVKSFSDASFSNSAKTAGTRTLVTWGSQVLLNSHALSNRYTSKAGS